jgi:hypothetical protein
MSDAIRIGQPVMVTGKVDADLAGVAGIVEQLGATFAIIAYPDGGKISADFPDIVPLDPQYESTKTAHELIKGFVEDWPEFDSDASINGSDMVEYAGNFYQEAKAALEKSNV